MKCRFCSDKVNNVLIDLGSQPPSNSYLTDSSLNAAELYLPLRIRVCGNCFLVQTEDYTTRETFFNTNYAYFSSTSKSWLNHAKHYAEQMIQRFSFSENSFIVEVASNDGYLLKNFVQKNIPCLGVEPTESTAIAAREIGIETEIEFFGHRLAKDILKRKGPANLIACKNVYAHVPDINDFTRGLMELVAPDGVITLEFPHLLQLLVKGQFDTIYHEHYSYLSVRTVEKIFQSCGLRIFDVEELPTHGGSVRIYGCKDNANHVKNNSVDKVIEKERRAGLFQLNSYADFQASADQTKNEFLKFLLDIKDQGKKVCGYGAAAKGNTLLNYAGVKPDLLPFIVDAAESKIGKFMPGSRIPIVSPTYLKDFAPDYIVIFPWNIADEITANLPKSLKKHAKIVTLIPELLVI